MSQVQSIAGAPVPQVGGEAQVRAAIARAAGATGVDFDYLLAQAKIESNLKPQAKAATSSATGLYQFTNSTWLSTLARHGEKHGLPWAASAQSDPSLRAQAMALRLDPQLSALMAGELANDNRAALTAALGHEPDASELYLAHFMGSAGATKFLNALAMDPAQSAAALMPSAAAANRAIFYGPDGAPRSVSEVMGVIRGKVEGAMGVEVPGSFDVSAPFAPEWAGGAAVPAPLPANLGPVAREFHAAAASAAPLPQQARPSMAETLRDAFALNSSAGASAPGHVRTAYARLSAMGL
ncbi:lytic transglycosylase domain-containing protein [Novosphingobium sp. MW5]|nr:lytic transglycosylase domain-containing protein [Novosphingobium sp. MW5]